MFLEVKTAKILFGMFYDRAGEEVKTKALKMVGEALQAAFEIVDRELDFFRN